MCEQYWLFMVGLWASCVSDTGYPWMDCECYMCEQYWLFMVGLWALCVLAILVIH